MIPEKIMDSVTAVGSQKVKRIGSMIFWNGAKKGQTQPE